MIRKYFISILLLPWVCLAQWEWQHPQPQGNTLWSLEFTESGVGVAVGDHGTIISTIDSGATWLIRESGTEHDLLSVYFLDADNGWIFGAEGTILKTADGGKNWIFLPGPDIHIFDGLFVNTDTGWVCGGKDYHAAIYRTNDGGQTWEEQIRYQSPAPLRSICSTENGNIFTSGMRQILRTTDGGDSWILYPAEADWDCRSICFTDSLTGWIAGVETWGTLILNTNDGGVTWSEQITGQTGILNRSLNDICFIDSQFGWACGTYGHILYTRDGGDHWSSYSQEFEPQLIAVHFSNSETGWAVGSAGVILKTENGGRDWEYKSSMPCGDLFDIFFLNSEVGFATGAQYNSSNAIIYKTENSGRNWSICNLPAINFMHAIHFPNDSIGWAVGSGNSVLKSVNYGRDWFRHDIGLTLSDCGAFYDVCFINPDTGIIVGENGAIIWTGDGGASWQRRSSGTGERLAAICFTDSETGWIGGNRGVILKTTDAGLNWQRISCQADVYLNSICFIDPDTGWIAGSNCVLRTTDGGIEWEVATIPLNCSLMSVCFTNFQSGRVVGFENRDFWLFGYAAYSDDGGISWTRERFPTANMLNEIVFSDNHNGWVCGMTGTILSTRNNGGIASIEAQPVTVPNYFKICAVYPNPCNSSTTIRYEIAGCQLVKISLFDIQGRKITDLVNAIKPAGTYEVVWDCGNFSSGIYFANLIAGHASAIKKILLIK